MTRWARANNVHKRQSTDAASWSQLKSAVAGGTAESGSKEGGCSNKQRHATWKDGKKPNKRISSDVNGFNEYLKQTRQRLTRGPKKGTEREQNTDDVASRVLNKFKQGENRRIKRQNTKKNNMVRERERCVEVPQIYCLIGFVQIISVLCTGVF